MKEKKETGQVTIVIALMMATFLFLIQFSIYTGILVNAKINLQNAADMAAFSGASVQARLLNQIGFLNYEMRRQYKKFLFRYYVLGTKNIESGDRAPANASDARSFYFKNRNYPGSSQYSFPTAGTDKVISPVPSVCITINDTGGDETKFNLCEKTHLEHVPVPPENSTNQVNAALRASLENMAAQISGRCSVMRFLNSEALHVWLYNTDPSMKNIKQFVDKTLNGGNGCSKISQWKNDLKALSAVDNGNNKADQDCATKFRAALGLDLITKSLMSGLGLIPKELLLSFRIKTLQSYVNFPAQTAINYDSLKSLRAQGDFGSRERTAQAFLSAFYTSGAILSKDPDSGLFNNLIMDELLPEGSNNQANLLKLNENKIGFLTFYSDFKSTNFPPLQNGQPGNATDNSRDCVQIPLVKPVSEFPVNYTKDPTSLVFYAVRLTAKNVRPYPGIFGGITLTAYSAAQPFGSRIGPTQFKKNEWVQDGIEADLDKMYDYFSKGQVGSQEGIIGYPYGSSWMSLKIPFQNNGIELAIPNLKINPEIYPKGTLSAGVLWDFFKALFPNSVPDSNTGFSYQNTDIAALAAMAPNPVEQGKWTIPSDTPSNPNTEDSAGDPFIKFYQKSSQSGMRGYHSFWAPIISKDDTQSESFKDKVEKLLKNNTNAANDPLLSDNAPAELDAELVTGLENYVNNLKNPASGTRAETDYESFNVVRVQDPFHSRSQTGELLPFVGLDSKIFWGRNGESLQGVRDAWVSTKDKAGVTEKGRVGYSVKYVAFDTLINKNGVTSNGSDAWTNSPAGDGEAKKVMGLIKH